MLTILPLPGMPEVRSGDDLARLVAEAAEQAGGLEDGDVVAVAQKVVSKAEGRIVRLADVEPSEFARQVAGPERDARQTEVVLREAVRIVRMRPGLIIAETRHGFVCAAAGVDASNAPERDSVILLPVDPDASAELLRTRLRELTGRTVGVVVTDTFGRAWREGIANVAVGAAGIEVLRDLRGQTDANGYELHATVVAVADEIAAAAELVMGKTNAVPAAVLRGLDVAGDGRARDLVMSAERDMFR
jgi:coenzyme F420-0:L-glutamate ligase/coenzyme F420-1:gamma-L-glutamate ligase